MRTSSFNFFHLAIGLFVVVVGYVLLHSFLSGSRINHRIMQHRTQMRGIHQGLVVYANSNRNWYPGIDEHGEDAGLNVQLRFKVLIDGDFFTPEYAVSPYEYVSDVRQWDGQAPFGSSHYSFAMLQVPEAGGRRAEWKQTLSSEAIVLSDRNTGTADEPQSVVPVQGEPRWWRGCVLWNDNHVDVEDEPVFETRYGEGQINPEDELYASDGPDDALLIHSGN